ncbi:MAG TPA: chemotaxis protein CheX [Anaeromyxobacteraceae bacterium]|nr:chemotaxis protein CheX [Anaeromyxobacteraceae bacterium]
MNFRLEPEAMATLVSGVTQTMLGLTFIPDGAKAHRELTWRTAVLPIAGQRPLTVGLSSDEHSCRRLSAAMFGCSPDDVDQNMMNDALRELVNMTAGLLKSTLGLNQALGLPRVISGADVKEVPSAMPEVIVLKADSLGLVLWMHEGIL